MVYLNINIVKIYYIQNIIIYKSSTCSVEDVDDSFAEVFKDSIDNFLLILSKFDNGRGRDADEIDTFKSE